MKENKQSRQRKNSFLKSNKYVIRILILGLILYSIYLFHDTLSPDEALYTWNSVQLNEDPSLITSSQLWKDQPILIYGVISLFDIFMPNLIAARVVMFLFGLLGIYLVYLLGVELRSKELGLISALFLLVNPWYWMMTNRILMDIPLTVFIMLTLLFLIRYIKGAKLSFFVYSMLFLIFALLTKYSALMIIPLMILLLILTRIRNRKMLFTSVGSILLVVVLTLTIANNVIGKYYSRISLSNFTNNFFMVLNNIYELLFGYVPDGLLPIFYIISLIAIVFVIYEIITPEQRANYMFLLLWILSVFGFRVFFGSDIARYLLPLLPALILFIVYIIFDVYSILQKRYKIRISKFAMKTIVLIIFLLFLVVGNKISYMASYNDPGFKEAGEWIGENVGEEDIIYAGSLRQIRYYSGIDYTTEGGKIYAYGQNSIKGIPKQISKIPVDHLNKTIYLQIDFRDDFQSEWVYPQNITKAHNINNLNFELETVVYKEMPFFIMPPNSDRNEFLEYFNVTPYEIVSNKSDIYISGAGGYTYDYDDGEFIGSIGFERADSIMDYAEFLFRRQSYLRQPVVLIFKRELS